MDLSRVLIVPRRCRRHVGAVVLRRLAAWLYVLSGPPILAAQALMRLGSRINAWAFRLDTEDRRMPQ